MKSFNLFFILIICCFSCQKITDPVGPVGWILQYENQDEMTYSSIHFLDKNDGWKVGDEGTIKKTTDSGWTWKKQLSETKIKLWDVYFVNSQFGWVCGDSNTIMSTKNSGNSWEKINPSVSNGRIFLSISFTDEHNGWTCNNNGGIFKSNNGGKDWILVKNLPVRGGSRLIVLDSETVYVLQGKLYKTFDGGSTWDSLSISYPKYYTSSDMFFLDKVSGWITTMNGTGGMWITEYPVVITNDGGNSWFSSEYVKDMGLMCCFFVNEKLGWIASLSNVYKTTDGGISWKLNFSTEHLGANKIYFLNENHGWILAWNGNIYKYIGY
jgi:photosystem II stability/assembly factor-like uncharacterized protein